MMDTESTLEHLLLKLGALERKTIEHITILKKDMRKAYDEGCFDQGEHYERIIIEMKQRLKELEPKIDVVEQKLYQLRRTKKS